MSSRNAGWGDGPLACHGTSGKKRPYYRQLLSLVPARDAVKLGMREKSTRSGTNPLGGCQQLWQESMSTERGGPHGAKGGNACAGGISTSRGMLRSHMEMPNGGDAGTQRMLLVIKQKSPRSMIAGPYIKETDSSTGQGPTSQFVSSPPSCNHIERGNIFSMEQACQIVNNLQETRPR